MRPMSASVGVFFLKVDDVGGAPFRNIFFSISGLIGKYFLPEISEGGWHLEVGEGLFVNFDFILLCYVEAFAQFPLYPRR